MKRKAAASDSHLDLLRNKVRCDVTFVVGPEKEHVECHKLFLIARSPVFEVMFQSRWTEAGTGTETGSGGHDPNKIILPDVHSKIFNMFLQFVYSDDLAFVSIQETEQLLYLADKYDVAKLAGECEEVLGRKLEVKNALEMHSIAKKYRLNLLFTSVEKLIRKNFSMLLSDPSFLSMEVELLSSYVASNGIAVNEIDLFNSLMKWSESQCAESGIQPSGENIRNILGPILVNIRFPLMNNRDFRKYVVPRNILTCEEKCAIFEYISLDDHGRSCFDETGLGFNVNPRMQPAVVPLIQNTTADYICPDSFFAQLITHRRNRSNNRRPRPPN